MRVPLYRHNLMNVHVDAMVPELTDILKGMSISSGPVCEKAQTHLAIELGVKNCFLTSSWTTGAIAVLLSFSFDKGGEVIIPATTFVATANAIRIAGLIPKVVDIDPKTKLIDFDKVLGAINNKTVAVMPVHLYGQMVDVKALKAIVPSHIKIIEDSAHGIECAYDGYRPGNHGDAAVFSFFASKTITTGEGGAVAIDDDDIAKRFNMRIKHGIDLSGWQRHNIDTFIHAIPEVLGIKATMPDILAVMVRPQLINLKETLKMRQGIADRYDKELSATFEKPVISANITTHSNHIYALGIDPARRDSMLNHLIANGVRTAVHYISLTKVPVMDGIEMDPCPHAERWGSSTFSIPCFAGMTQPEQDHVLEVLSSFR